MIRIKPSVSKPKKTIQKKRTNSINEENIRPVGFNTRGYFDPSQPFDEEYLKDARCQKYHQGSLYPERSPGPLQDFEYRGELEQKRSFWAHQLQFTQDVPAEERKEITHLAIKVLRSPQTELRSVDSSEHSPDSQIDLQSSSL